MPDIPRPQIGMQSAPLSWSEKRLLNLLVNLGSAGSAAKGMGKDVWGVSTPGIAEQLIRKFKGQPNNLHDLPNKAAMFLLNFLGEPEGEMETIQSRLAGKARMDEYGFPESSKPKVASQEVIAQHKATQRLLQDRVDKLEAQRDKAWDEAWAEYKQTHPEANEDAFSFDDPDAQTPKFKAWDRLFEAHEDAEVAASQFDDALLEFREAHAKAARLLRQHSGPASSLVPEFDWSKTSSVGAKEGDAFAEAKQELFPGKRELSTKEIGQVSKRAAEIASARKSGGPLADQIMNALAKHPEASQGGQDLTIGVRRLMEDTPGLEKYGTEEGWYSDEVQNALKQLQKEGRIFTGEYSSPGPGQGKIVGISRRKPAGEPKSSLIETGTRKGAADSIRQAARESREAARARAAAEIDRRRRDRKTPKSTRMLREALGQ